MSEGERVQGLFLDLNSYFASVEQEVQPELRQQPVAVVPMLADTTCCIAASYEAKAYGIRTGTGVIRCQADVPLAQDGRGPSRALRAIPPPNCGNGEHVCSGNGGRLD